jgi:hypothetical protein
LILAQIIDDAVGCGSIDPTDAANYSVVTIVDNTEHAVTRGCCQGTYCTIEGPKFLQSGERTRAEAACAASGGDMTSWWITNEDGTLAGYIAVDTPRKHDGLVYRISAASPDRMTATQSIDPHGAGLTPTRVPIGRSVRSP